MSNLIFEKIQQTLAAGGLLKIGIAGNFLRISEAQWPVTLRLLRGGQVIGSASNMLAGDYIRDVDFDGFEIINGSTAQAVTVQISGGGAGSDRVLGEVSVINGEIQRVKAGQCFIGYSLAYAVAGQMAHTQIWNPVANTKNLVINKISVFGQAAAASIGLSVASAALASLLAGTSSAKKFGGAATSAELRYSNYAAIQGVQVANFQIPTTGQNIDFQFSEPLIIGPGYGCNIFNSTLNAPIYSTFQWNEEPV